MAGTEPWVTAVIAAVTSTVAAWLGYLGSLRGKKVDQASSLIEQIREWATQVQQSEERCRVELSTLRSEMEHRTNLLEAEVAVLRREVREP